MESKRLYLIDATAFCYRAFYALGNLATSFGQPTNAIYGFTTILNKILKDHHPEYLAVCFDLSRDTFRQKRFADYKIQRSPMPDGLKSQIPLIKEIIAAYRISLFEREGFEADDIIATLSRKAREHGISVTIVSSDKDILQLVDDKTVVFSPYEAGGTTYDYQKVVERFGVGPERVPDIIGLMGDSADNIPGVRGVGEKTAEKLLKQFGSVEELIRNIGQVKQDKLRSTLEAGIESMHLSKELAILDKNIDLDFDPEGLRSKEPDYKELFRLFKHLEFKRLIDDLPEQPEAGAACQDAPLLQGGELKNILGNSEELYINASSAHDLVCACAGKAFAIEDIGGSARSALRDPAIKKIGFDLKKIKLTLAQEGIELEGLYFDVMIAAYLLNPTRTGYTLNDLAWDYLSQQLGTVSSQKGLDLVLKARPVLEGQLRDKDLYRLFRDVEMPLVEVLARMQMTGIKIDANFLKDLARDLEKRLIKLIEQIYDLSGSQFNINSPKQLREILFEKLKLPVSKRTKTGPSTDEEVLKNLAKEHKLPALLLEYRQLTKLKNTYIDTLPEMVDAKTGRIHASFNQTGTETGRLSSSAPNLQNIPIKTEIGAKIRQAIIAFSENSFIVSCDYSQIELRILAHLSGDEELIAAFKSDKDIHRRTAGLIYGVKEDDVDDNMRESAKRVNFGIVYGLSPYGLARDLGVSVDAAQAFIEAYFSTYPRVKRYIDEQIERAKRDGFVTTILGRRRYIPEIGNKNQNIREFAQRQAVNTPIQGSASDLIKLAMVNIHQDILKQTLDSRMIIQIHDELVFDVPAKELGDLLALVRSRMENCFTLAVPIKVSIKKGKNWLEMEEIK
ncbi:MAG: DNA polymerase I [Candidatus Omnitrophica bacterium]|nr:DNA polymerase I [Candidatus Omnitrophota bacterium]